MSNTESIALLFVTLFICTLDGYSMMSYRYSAWRAYACFGAVTVLCLALNSYITVRFGIQTLHKVMLFTIGAPYFVLILLITKEKISQTVFNFWLWINVYEIITSISAFINDITVRSYLFMSVLRCVILVGYFFLYNRLIKKRHKRLMEELDINWWIFSFIPMSFTVLISLINYFFGGADGIGRNYPIMLTIHVLMLLVYTLIFYTFKTVYDSMARERMAQDMKEQIAMQKKQYELYLERAETELIFRHDARHRDALLLSCLESGDTESAAELLRRELTEIDESATLRFCENTLVNAVVTEYYTKSAEKGIRFTARVKLPDKLLCDEAELCVMLSNLLENSLAAAKSYILLDIKQLNSQLSVRVRNDYAGKTKKDESGRYLTTKPSGTGLGLKSVAAIVKNNSGFLEIDDRNGVFAVFATLKN